MAQYRKKSEIIEAIQLTADNVEEVIAFCGDKIKSHPMTGVVIETLDGNRSASVGHYIIKNEAGDLTPLNAEYFEATYEEHKIVAEVPNRPTYEVAVVSSFSNDVLKYNVLAMSFDEAITKTEEFLKEKVNEANVGRGYIDKIPEGAFKVDGVTKSKIHTIL